MNAKLKKEMKEEKIQNGSTTKKRIKPKTKKENCIPT